MRITEGFVLEKIVFKKSQLMLCTNIANTAKTALSEEEAARKAHYEYLQQLVARMQSYKNKN